MAGLAATFGSGAMTNSIGEIAHAACIFAIGTNTTAAHPVIGLRIKEAARRGELARERCERDFSWDAMERALLPIFSRYESARSERKE